MTTTYFDPTPRPTAPADAKRLGTYRTEVAAILESGETNRPEAVMAYPTPEVVSHIRALTKSFSGIKHLVVVGIGGSSLGLEAVHAALGEQGVALSLLDCMSPAAITDTIRALSSVKRPRGVAVCVISKSGATTETLANASVLLRILADRLGPVLYERVVCIGDPNTSLQNIAKKLKAHYVSMPAAIGGRFSVATEVGLVPLALLGHDIESWSSGFVAAARFEAEAAAAASASSLYAYLKAGVRHYNFFAFDKRLAPLGAWYRQLSAESLGKATTRVGKSVALGFVPTISTPVELHSIGQLYLSGFAGVYTEFVSLDESGDDYKIGPTSLAPQLKKFTLDEISAALYGGVVAAYQEKQLPFRATVLSEDLPQSLGRYMGTRMLETMYLAHLLDVTAFDQPNVELYKQKTRELLGL